MENQLLIVLSRNKLLKNVDIMKIDLRNIRGRLITIKEGEILFRERDIADNIYLVISGEINILKKKLLGKTKSFIYNDNDFFGHEEYFEETTRTSTAVALTDTYLIALSNEEVDLLIEQDDEIFVNMKEPIAVIDEELFLDKAGLDEFKTAETDLPQALLTESPAAATFTEEINIADQIETQEYFQSISDASRFDEENLVQPLEQIEAQQDKLVQSASSEAAHTDESQYDESFFLNEIGTQESEFELPDDFSAQEVSENETEEDLDDALFQILSGNERTSFEIPQQFESEQISEEESSLSLSDKSQTETSNISEPIFEEHDKALQLNSSELAPPKEDFFYKDETIFLSDSEKEPDETPPPHEPAPKDYQSEEIYAEVDARIKALKETNSQPEQIIDKPAIEQLTSEKRRVIKMRTDELEKIIKAAELVNSTIRVDEVLQNIIDVATDLANADRGTLYLIDREKNELWSLIVLGNEIKEIRLKIGEGLAGHAAKSGELINIQDVQKDPRFKPDYDRASGYTTKNMLCFPIKNNRAEIIGVLQLLNSKKGAFSERDEEFLTALSIHAAIAIQNAEMVEKLLQTERIDSLGKMANFLIQDIKKPILVSKRYAEHLMNKELPPDAVQVIEMLLDQLVQVADIVQTTSSYSEGKTILRTQNVSLNNILTDYASRVESFVESRHCKVINEFDKDVTIKLDVKEFFQCYMHIIKNACDAMPDGGNIHISTRRGNKKIKIIFKDNGLGIPEGFKDKIFEPFMTHGKKEGTGLGLSITKKVVEALNGTIDVESVLGSGATFIISLPIAVS